jgi:hypothetical protein
MGNTICRSARGRIAELKVLVLQAGAGIVTGQDLDTPVDGGVDM